MIYLIETTYYNKDTKEVLDLLKIGYTEDSKKDKRFMAYRMHNPGHKLLYEVLGYTEDNNKDKRFQLYKLHNPTCKVLYEIPDLPEDIEKQESC